jgi:transposase
LPIIVIQEAGLDGFWIHRVLQQEGIEGHVVDPASIATSRRRRRAKTDRIDGETLLRALLAYKRGEPRVCAMVKAPTVEEEDRRRLCRERKALIEEGLKKRTLCPPILWRCRKPKIGLVHRERFQEIPRTRVDGDMPSFYMMQRLTRSSLRERQLIREENLLPVPYACNGKRLHFHELPPKVNGYEGIAPACFLTRVRKCQP